MRETTSHVLDYINDRPPLRNGIAAMCALGAVGLGFESLSENQLATKAQVAQLEVEHEQQNGQIDRLGDITKMITGLSEVEISGAGLARPDQLPAYGQAIDDTEKNALEDSAVKIYQRVSGSSEWYGNCSGSLIDAEAGPYVLTARHCFDTDMTHMGKGGVYPEGRAVNITQMLASQYAVVQADEVPGYDAQAVVMDISTVFDADAALLRLGTPEALTATGVVPIPDYAERQHEDSAPGENAISFSAPQSSGNHVVEGIGTYLGAAPHPTNGQMLDYVGLINANTASKDGCYFGSSGSQAGLAGGYITGPLSYRNNYSYDSGPEHMPLEARVRDVTHRLQIEASLDIDLSRYHTVCGYTRTSDDPTLIGDLINGFDSVHPAAPLPHK